MTTRRLVLNLFNLCVFVAGGVACELAFGDWFSKEPDTLPRHIVPTNVRIRYDARKLYPTSRETVTYTRDNFGLRGTHSSLKDIDILVVGGSTTDQRYIDDEATWDAVMQGELRKRGYNVTVANAAIDGQSTIGHVHSLETWISHIPELRPSYIIFYLGINDSYYLRERNELHTSDRTEPVSAFRKSIEEKSLFLGMLGSVLPTSGTSDSSVVRPTTTHDERITVSNILDDATNSFSAREPDAKPGNMPYLEVYEENLVKLDHLSRLMGAKAIFVSHPAGTCRFEGMTVLQQEGTSFDCLSLAYINRATHIVSGRNYIPFIEADSLLTLTRPSEVYDYVHQNERGAELIGTLIAERLSKSVDLSTFSPAAQK